MSFVAPVMALVHRSSLGPGWEGVEAVPLVTAGWTTWIEVAPTPDQIAYVDRCVRQLASLPPGACFMNCQQLVLWTDSERRLQYAEGIGKGYADALTPLLHAWLVLDGEVLVDVTWRTRGASSPIVIGTWAPEARVYQGRTFTHEEVFASVATGMWTSILSPEPPPSRRNGRRRGRR